MFTSTKFNIVKTNTSLVITSKPNVTDKNCTLFQHLPQFITSRPSIRAGVSPTSQHNAHAILINDCRKKKYNNGVTSNGIMFITTFTTVN